MFMTNAQRQIIKYIDQNFAPGSVNKEFPDQCAVKITDRSGESLTFSINIFGDIMLANTKTVIAESDLPHDLMALSRHAEPHSWTNLPVNWEKLSNISKQMEKESVKSKLSSYQNLQGKEEKQNNILQKERVER